MSTQPEDRDARHWTHPGTPEVIPAIPEHVLPTQPDDFEARNDVLYCIRCGRLLWSKKYGHKKPEDLKPCRVVPVELRTGER